MIIIGILFVGIISFEWHYLQKHKRKRRTFFCVLGSAACMFLGIEIIAYFKEQCTVVQVIGLIFEPLEKMLQIGK